jgi:signal transduction histidine kinase
MLLNLPKKVDIHYVVKDSKYNNHQDEVIVGIKDTGTGIDSETFPRLFTKFATKSDLAGGTGLGLFISKSIVESHGGRIWANNNSDILKNREKRGATVKLHTSTYDK